MAGAVVLAAAAVGCSGRPATGVECGTEIQNGHVQIVGSQQACQEVSNSIGPRISEALVTGELPENVQIVEKDEK